AGRAARQDNSIRVAPFHFRRRNAEGNDLRIDLQLTDPPRDDLSVLRTEIEDEDARVRRLGSCAHDSGMSLRHAVFIGWIVRRTVDRTEITLARDTSLQLVLDLTVAALLEGISAAHE